MGCIHVKELAMHACMHVCANKCPKGHMPCALALRPPPQKVSQQVEPPPSSSKNAAALLSLFLEPKRHTLSLYSTSTWGQTWSKKQEPPLPSIQCFLSHVWMNSSHLSTSAFSHWLPSPPRTNNNYSYLSLHETTSYRWAPPLPHSLWPLLCARLDSPISTLDSF